MVVEVSGCLNVTKNCLDCHIESRNHDAAIIWHSEASQGDKRTISYGELSTEVNRLANGLKSLGAGRGDAVTLILPEIPEAIVAVLACARIGAIHSLMETNLTTATLANRIKGIASKIVITANINNTDNKTSLKEQVDKAINLLEKTNHINHVIVLDLDFDTAHARDVDYHELNCAQSDFCEAEDMSEADTLLITYDAKKSEQANYHSYKNYLEQVPINHSIYEALSNGDTILIDPTSPKQQASATDHFQSQPGNHHNA